MIVQSSPRSELSPDRRWVAVAACAALLCTGCISLDARLPDAWASAMRGQSTAGVEGVYADAGEIVYREGGNAIRPARLSSQLNEAFRDPQFCPAAERIALRIKDGKLEIDACNGTTVIGSRTLEVEVQRNGRVVMIRGEPVDLGRRRSGTSGTGRTDLRLSRGADGCLYLELNAHAKAVVKSVIPVFTSATYWGRWTPAPPEDPK